MKNILLLLFAALLWNCTDYAADWDKSYKDSFSDDPQSIVSMVCVEGTSTSSVDGDCSFEFICKDNAWLLLNMQCSNASDGQNSNSVCEEGMTTSLSDGMCVTNFICEENAWHPVGNPLCETQEYVESSESGGVYSSSSGYKMVSTSTVTGSSYGCSKAMFCGKSGDTRVKTGFDDGTGSYGYWFYYGDYNDGGSSSFSWTYGGTASTFVEKSVMPYGGIKGKAVLSSEENAYLGLGFNVAGETQKGVNVSDWKGLCVIYQSSAPFFLEIVDASAGELTGYNNYKVTLPTGNKSNTAYVANMLWSEFSQEEGWGNFVSSKDVLETTALVSFKFKKVTSLTNNFAIIAIGKYGTCK